MHRHNVYTVLLNLKIIIHNHRLQTKTIKMTAQNASIYFDDID